MFMVRFGLQANANSEYVDKHYKISFTEQKVIPKLYSSPGTFLLLRCLAAASHSFLRGSFSSQSGSRLT